MERLLNRMAGTACPVWKITGQGKEIRACTTLREYRYLWQMARECGVRLRAKEKHGLPFLLGDLRKRPGLPIGVGVFFATVVGLSLFLWNIRILGAENLPVERIQEHLEQDGALPGKLIQRIDRKRLEEDLALGLPEIGWVTIYRRGSTLVVDIREKDAVPEMLSEDTPCNVKAKISGQILSVSARVGRSMVEVGDVVAEGDLLISGVWEGKEGDVYSGHAKGQVIAATRRVVEETVPLVQERPEFTGRILRRRSLCLFGMRLPLDIVHKPQEEENLRYQYRQERFPVRCMDTDLPLEIREERWEEYTLRRVQYDIAQAQRLAREALQSRIAGWEGVTVHGWEEKWTQENGELKLTAVLRCEEDIAREEELLIEG